MTKPKITKIKNTMNWFNSRLDIVKGENWELENCSPKGKKRERERKKPD